MIKCKTRGGFDAYVTMRSPNDEHYPYKGFISTPDGPRCDTWTPELRRTSASAEHPYDIMDISARELTERLELEAERDIYRKASEQKDGLIAERNRLLRETDQQIKNLQAELDKLRSQVTPPEEEIRTLHRKYDVVCGKLAAERNRVKFLEDTIARALRQLNRTP